MPYGNSTHRMKDFVDAIRKLDISEDIKNKIFSGNFYRLLRGKKDV
jgi:hypothetical protein